MQQLRKSVLSFVKKHKHAILFWTVVICSGSMIFKGLMQLPQINHYKSETAKLEKKIDEERNRQAEIDNLKTKVNTDEYIERIASEKLGLVKSNAKIFLDVSEED